MEGFSYNPDKLRLIGRGKVLYASPLVPKNLDRVPPPIHQPPSREKKVRNVGVEDIGTELHGVVASIADGREFYARKRLNALHTSARWKLSYGGGLGTVTHNMLSAGTDMVRKIREGKNGLQLCSEPRVMASSKARGETREVLVGDEGSVESLIRNPLDLGETPRVPLTSQAIQEEEDSPFSAAELLVYGIQAVPDLLGFLPKSEAAKRLIQPLRQLLYQDNNGKRRFLLNPELLQAKQALIKEVMNAILARELEVLVFEMKTCPTYGKSYTEKSEDWLYMKYSEDISHTVLALLQIFQAADPDAVENPRILLRLLKGITVQLGLIDFPAIQKFGEPIVPLAGSVKTRLVTIPGRKVRKACARRLRLNKMHVTKTPSPVQPIVC